VAGLQGTALPNGEEAGGIALVRFTEALCAAPSLPELERRFAAGLGPLMAVPMYGFNVLDRTTWRPELNVAVNVSEIFVARYERDGRDVDPVLRRALATGRATYNLDIMTQEEWLESPLYRHAYCTHSMRHVIDAPVVADGEVCGSLHVADSDAARDVTPREVRLVEAFGRVVGCAIEGIRARERLEAERDKALAALELMGAAVVISDPAAVELRANDVARDLMADVVNAEEELHRLIALPRTDERFSRRVEVQLVDGATATLHGHSSPARPDGGGLITVLEIAREAAGVPPALLAPLTPREREVALLVVDGLADREIAESLSLSRHTVSQYVKRIYRKLDVDSRVALTRVLLGPPGRTIPLR
jgi:DNA-binding CsgD family transcriptional regulator